MKTKLILKTITVAIILIFLTSIAPLNPVNPQGQQIKPNVILNPAIAFVYSVGGKGDQGFNDMAFSGVLLAEKLYPAMTFTEYQPLTQGDANTEFSNLAAAGTYDLIIAIGFTHKAGVESAAQTYTSQNFLLIDEFTTKSNVAGVKFRHEEGSFLAGMMAAMVSNNGRIGFIGGLNSPLINEFRYGYEQGANYINNYIIVDVSYVGSFGDPFTASIMTDTMVTNGADVIFAAAGRSGIGVINRTFEYVTNGTLVYSIGVDINQDALAPGVVLTSMMKRMDLVILDNIGKIVNENWVGGNSDVGLAENGVGLTNMNFTQPEKYTKFGDTKTRWDVIQETIPLIVNGNIVLDPVNTLPITTTTTPVFDPTTTIIAPTVTVTNTQTDIESHTVTETTSITVDTTTTTEIQTVFTETVTITDSKSEAFLPAFTGIIIFFMVGIVWIKRKYLK